MAAPKQRLDEALADLCQNEKALLAKAREKMTTLAASLEALSPLATMARGYAVCLTPAGRLVRSAAAVEPGQDLDILLHDGRLSCLIKGKEESDGKPQENL